MKEFKGTKGKWISEKTEPFDRKNTSEGHVSNVIIENSRVNFDIWGHYATRKEVEANAKLIAAAPELLEALQINNKIIKDFIKHGKADMDFSTFSAFNNVFCRSEKAISKALD